MPETPTPRAVDECRCPFYRLSLCVPDHEHHRYGCKPHGHVSLPDHTHFWSSDDGRGYRECAFCSATLPTTDTYWVAGRPVTREEFARSVDAYGAGATDAQVLAQMEDPTHA